MAVGKLSGVMLQNNLERQGVDLTFDTDLLHLDVARRRIGINTTDTDIIRDRLTVAGNVRAWDLTTNSCAYFIGNLSPCNVANIGGLGTVVYIAGTGALALPQGNANSRPANTVPGSIRHLYELDPNTGTPATNTLEWYDGAEWVLVGTGAGGEITAESILPTGTSNTFPISDANATTLSTLVVINGVVQDPDDAYTVANGNLILSEIPAVSDKISLRYFTQGRPESVLAGSLANISNAAPASSQSPGERGDIRYDNSYLYICVEANTWIRSNIVTSF
jgi:hypothetical protein